MKCPICNVDLIMSERQGIEIDYCPQCRGVWLDRGELDKIIERSVSAAPGAPSNAPQRPAAAPAQPAPFPQQAPQAAPTQPHVPQPHAAGYPNTGYPQHNPNVGYAGHNQWMHGSKERGYAQQHNQFMHNSKNQYHNGYRKKKRGGFLGDLFDFDD